MKRFAWGTLLLLVVVVVAVWVLRGRSPQEEKRETQNTEKRSGAPSNVHDSNAPRSPTPVPTDVGALRVHAMDANGPLAGARVQILFEPTHASFRGQTDTNGLVGFEGLNPGEWRVGARHRGYLLAQDRVTVEVRRTVEVTLRMSEGARVQGTVTSAAGQPLVGAEVTVLDHERRIKQDLIAKTNEQGQYTIEGIPLEKLGLMARMDRFRPQERYDIQFSQPGELQIHDFVLDVGTIVSGRVVNELDEPLAGVYVTVGAIGDPASAVVRTDQEGRFMVAGLGDKSFGLSARTAGYGVAIIRGIAPNTVDLVIRLYRGGCLEGRVVPALESFSICLYHYEVDLQRYLRVETKPYRGNKTGEFIYADVAPGEYLVSVLADGYEGSGTDTIRVDVPLSSDEVRSEVVSGVRVAVRAGETLRGLVLEVRVK